MTSNQKALLYVLLLAVFLLLNAVTASRGGVWPGGALPVDPGELWRLNF